MKKFCAALLSGLLMSSTAFAAPEETGTEVGEYEQMAEQTMISEQELDNITVNTYIIELSAKGKEKLKTLSNGQEKFIVPMPVGDIHLEEYGTLIAPVASFNIDVGKRIESRQELAPITVKMDDREIVIGGIDNGLKFNLEYIEHKDGTVTLNSEVFLIANQNPKNKKGVIVPETNGHYLNFAQNMPIGMCIVAGGFQKFGNSTDGDNREFAVIQVAYDKAPEQK